MTDDLTPDVDAGVTADVDAGVTADVDAGVTADVDGGGVITQPVAGRTIWRRVGKAAVLVVVGAIVIFVLFTWVFPWVHANGFDPTMDA